MLGERVAELARVLPVGRAPATRRRRPRCRTSATGRTARSARCSSGSPPPRPVRRRCSTTSSGPTTRRSSWSRTCSAARRARRCWSRARLPRRRPARPPCWPRSRRPGATGASSTCGSRRCPPTRRRRCSATALPARVREELFRLSGGNPFYLEQLARGAAPAAAATAPARRTAAELPAAPSRRRSGRRSRALGEPARRLAAGRGGGRRPGRARPRRGGGRGPRGRGARRARRAGPAPARRAHRRSPRRYRFRHPIVRRAAYEAAGEGWRLAAHARAAAALERTGGALTARAHHLERCAAPGDDAAVAVLAQAGHAAAPTRARRGGALVRRRAAAAARRRRRAASSCSLPLATALASTGRLEQALRRCSDVLAARARRSSPSCARGSSPRAPRARTCSAATAPPTSGSPRRSTSCPSARGAAAAMLEAELAADALYDCDFAALAGRAPQARATARALGEPGLRALTAALDASPTTAQGRLDAAEAARAEAAAALDAMDDEPARRPARGAVLPRLRRVPVRALRRRDRPPAARARRLARVRPGPVRRADDGRARARARGARPARTRRSTRSRARSRRRGSSGNRQVLSWALVGEGWVAAMTGDLERAARAAEEAVALLADLADSILTLATHGLAAVDLPRGGRRRPLPRRGGGGRRAGRSRASSPAAPRGCSPCSPAPSSPAGAPEAAAAASRGRAATCSTASRCRSPRRRSSTPRRCWRWRTGAAAAIRRRGCAEGGVALAEQVGAVVHAGRLRALAGRALARAGDRDAALAALHARRGRARGVRRAPAARRGGAGAAPARRPRRRRRQRRGAGGEGLAALSGREREIAELVALGPHEPRDRRRAVPEREDRRGPPAQRLRQARRLRPRRGRGDRRPLPFRGLKGSPP